MNQRIDELCRAIESDDVERIEELVAAEPGLVNSLEGTPPPLHWAVYCDSRRAVEALLDNGADLEQRDRDRQATPLDYAVVYARTEVIPVLASRGGDMTRAMEVALKGASGGFEEFGELPSRGEYDAVVELLRELVD